MPSKKDFKLNSSIIKFDLKSSIMDKALGIKQDSKKSKKAIKSSPFIQSLSKPITRDKKAGSKLKTLIKDNKTNKQKRDSGTPNLFVGAIILIVLVSLIYVLNLDFNLDSEKEESENNKEKTNKQTGKFNENEINPVTFEERYANCIIESNVNIKDNCLQILAIEFNKDVLCEDLVNLDVNLCKRAVWKTNAIVSQELDSCKKLFSERDKLDCVKQIALNTSDKTLCSKMAEVVLEVAATEINSCLIDLAMQEKDLSICNEIDGSMRETCEFSTVLAISDPNLCVVFELPTIKHDCIARIAINNKDISLCYRITNLIQKNKCINDLS